MLGRRQGEVRVGVRVVGVVVVVFGVCIGVVLILVLLLRVLLGALWRTVFRHPIIGGVVGWQFILAGRRATWKLDGDV